MERFKNVLVVLDMRTENSTLITHATELCKRNQAHMTLVTVLDDLSRSTGITAVWLEDLQEKLTEAQQASLHKLATTIRRQGIRTDIAVLCGTPFLEIIRAVLRSEYDLVMTPGGESGGGGTVFMGSTNMHLMRKCPCPVWVIKSSQSDGFRRILAAVDPDPSKPVQDELNHKILDLATSLAQMDHGQLHIVHAWGSTVDLPALWTDAILPSAEVARIAEESRRVQATRFAKLIAAYDVTNLDHHIHLLRGNPRKLIPELTKKYAIELIVMGTVCRTGIAGLFIGNTAENVLRQVNCSVLAVKPDGFVTPVRLECD